MQRRRDFKTLVTKCYFSIYVEDKNSEQTVVNKDNHELPLLLWPADLSYQVLSLQLQRFSSPEIRQNNAQIGIINKVPI
jgi:hypothetical protein